MNLRQTQAPVAEQLTLQIRDQVWNRAREQVKEQALAQVWARVSAHELTSAVELVRGQVWWWTHVQAREVLQ